MITPAISNLFNPTNALTNAPASGSPAAKQSGASSDIQFKQMLSRGIEERRNQAEPSKPIVQESSAAKQATQSAQSPAKTNKTSAGEESKSTAIDEDATAPAAEAGATSVEPAKAKGEVAADAENDDDQAALAASADELLALVASLAQGGTLPTDTSADAPVDDTTQPASVDADAAAVVAASAAVPGAKSADLTSAVDSSDAEPASAAGIADVAVQATLTALRNGAASEAATSEEAGAATSEEPGAGTEFDASLAQATDKNGAADANATLAQRQFSQNEPATATQSTAELHAKTAADTQVAATPIPSINIAPQSQVSLQQVQTAAAAAADKLAPRVGSNGWDQALGQKVVWMVAGEQQSASLTLNPPDLGPLQVVLNVSNSQATVNFTAAQPEVRQALQDAMPKLREMLGDAGIQLGQANVGAGTPNNHQQGGFGERQQPSRGTGQKIDDRADTPVHTVRGQAITGGGQGLVDTFA